MLADEKHAHPQFDDYSRRRTASRAPWALTLIVLTFICLQWHISHPDFMTDALLSLQLSRATSIRLVPSSQPFDGTRSTTYINAALWSTQSRRHGVYLPAFPRQIDLPTSAVRDEEIVFAIATSARLVHQRIRQGLWPYFMKGSACVILLGPDDRSEVKKVRDSIAEAGLSCHVEVSKIERYPARVLALPERAFAKQREIAQGANLRWLVIGDDDTVWLDKRALRRMLAKYDFSQDVFIGANSERQASVRAFGQMTFGGAGMILSAALVETYAAGWQACADRWTGAIAGDEALNRCVGFLTNKDLAAAYHPEPDLHQMDIIGDAFGFLQSGISVISLHHYFTVSGVSQAPCAQLNKFIRALGLLSQWAQIMPEWHLEDDRLLMIKVIMEAASFLGSDNVFRRYAFDGGKALLVNGYSITTYSHPLSDEDLEAVEMTWDRDSDSAITATKVRPAIVELGQRAAVDLTSLDDIRRRKSSYFLADVRKLPLHGQAVFTYRNDRGKRIELHWSDAV